MIEFCVQVEHFYSWCVCCPLVAEVIFIITASIRDVCQKPPSERLFPDKYGGFVNVWKKLFGRYDLFLDTLKMVCMIAIHHVLCHCFVAVCFLILHRNVFFFNVKGVLENTEKERTNRLIRLKPPTNIWSET